MSFAKIFGLKRRGADIVNQHLHALFPCCNPRLTNAGEARHGGNSTSWRLSLVYLACLLHI